MSRIFNFACAAALGLLALARPALAENIELRMATLAPSGSKWTEVFDKGAPVSDLRDDHGARGHCVIVNADATQYQPCSPLGGAGAKVQFHTTLPTAGKYKIWAELRPAGKPLLASFVVDVPSEAAHPHGKEPHGRGHGHGDDHGHGEHGHSH